MYVIGNPLLLGFQYGKDQSWKIIRMFNDYTFPIALFNEKKRFFCIQKLFRTIKTTLLCMYLWRRVCTHIDGNLNVPFLWHTHILINFISFFKILCLKWRLDYLLQRFLHIMNTRIVKKMSQKQMAENKFIKLETIKLQQY